MYTVYIGFTKSKSSFVWPNQRTWSNSEVVQRDFTPYSLQLYNISHFMRLPAFQHFIHFPAWSCFLFSFFCVCLPTRFLALFFSLCFFYPYLPMCCFPACKNCGNFYVAFMLSGKINWFLFTIAFECWNVWSVPSFPRVARWLAWYVMGRCRAVWVLAKWMWWIGIWILSPQGMGG